MCGIVGFITTDKREDASSLERSVKAMTDVLRHRGPDDSGVWLDAELGVALGHRRLSVIDLSPLGHQPMVSADGQFILSYNGEVYNFQELRRELAATGYPFKGHSDTEVLLAGFAHWGVHETLRRSDGMFALAVWNRQTRRLTLARDRAGKKPLYYGWRDKCFFFSSELKAVRAHPNFVAEIDRDALALYLCYSWMPCPHTIYRGLFQLSPGTSIEIDPADETARKTKQRPFWSARDVAEAGARNPLGPDIETATRAAESVLSEAVAARMVADVSVGAFLSGGVDSSVVVALMQAQATRPVKTFSIGFTEEVYNEAEHAKAVAEHLGTDHTELYVTPADCMDVIPKLPTLYDEPLGDYSQIPTYLVSALARREVTVALSGDGGDELFAGYNSYPPALARWNEAHEARRRWPEPVRKHAVPHLIGFARSGQDALAKIEMLPAKMRRRMGKRFRKLEKNLTPLTIAGPAEVYARRRQRTARPDDLVIGARDIPTRLTESADWAEVDDPLLAMQHLDFITYMVDDVLVKVDRASMACSLEVRCPMLDPAVIELAWRLPQGLRLGPDGGKPVLRSVLANYVPRHLFERPKQGFDVPLALWLRDPLRDWAEELLDGSRLAAEGYLRPAGVRTIWRQHLSGEHEHTFLLWSILMFQAWLEHWHVSESMAQPIGARGAAQ